MQTSEHFDYVEVTGSYYKGKDCDGILLADYSVTLTYDEVYRKRRVPKLKPLKLSRLMFNRVQAIKVFEQFGWPETTVKEICSFIPSRMKNKTKFQHVHIFADYLGM